MKRSQVVLWTMTVLLSCLLPVQGQPEATDKCLAPYFFVSGNKSGLDQLPLKHMESAVNISGIIADVKITQIYKNEGQAVLEAIYIFPASTRAAVYAMKMHIGERTIEAKIDRREKARQSYEQALGEGRTASLLEQQRPNVFQMNVGNILPGDEIVVELFYTEMLSMEKNLYEFVFPTVVGPRYSNQIASAAPETDRWVENPYLHEGQAAPYTFDLSVTLSGGMPISEIFSPSHQVVIDYQSKTQAKINLADGAGREGNRDFILKYRLVQKEIASGLLLERGEKENFFLLMLQPPERVKTEQIPGREYIFIVDVSGSMHGFPLDISKKLLTDLIGRLRPSDRFNVLLFAAGSELLAPSSLPATRANIDKALRLIGGQSGGGGTELLPALKRALALTRDEDYSRSVIIATDGYVNVEKEAFELIRKNLGQANFFSFGIGSSVNRYIIEGMARAGMGEAFVITQANEAEQKAAKFREYISSPVLTGISYTIDGFDAYDVEPLAIPDVLSERPVILYGKWRGEPSGQFRFEGKTGNSKTYQASINVSDYQTVDDQAALKYLWARHRLAMLSDYNQVDSDQELIEGITVLGLKYNLLTAYTSFVAIDSEIRTTGEKVTRVHQPLPLPQGVSDMALMAVSTSGPGSFGYRSKSGGLLKAAPEPRLAELTVAGSGAMKETLTVLVTDLEGIRTDLQGELQNLIETHRSDLRDSYTQAGISGLDGKVEIRIMLNSSGQIKSVSILSDDFNNKVLEEYIKTVLKKWQFGSGNIRENSSLTFSLEFKQ